jgi:hypothetical protein
MYDHTLLDLNSSAHKHIQQWLNDDRGPFDSRGRFRLAYNLVSVNPVAVLSAISKGYVQKVRPGTYTLSPAMQAKLDEGNSKLWYWQIEVTHDLRDFEKTSLTEIGAATPSQTHGWYWRAVPMVSEGSISELGGAFETVIYNAPDLSSLLDAVRCHFSQAANNLRQVRLPVFTAEMLRWDQRMRKLNSSDEGEVGEKQFSDSDIGSLELRSRTRRILKNAGIEHIDHLLCLSEMELEKLPRLGRKSLFDLKRALAKRNLVIGVNQREVSSETNEMVRCGMRNEEKYGLL